jgi:hypothetical protein
LRDAGERRRELAAGVVDQPVDAAVGGQHRIDAGLHARLVADVQHWRTFPAENHGWILIGDETERSAMRFNSRGEFGGPVLELDLIPASANVPIPMGWLLIGGAALLGSALMRRR